MSNSLHWHISEIIGICIFSENIRISIFSEIIGIGIVSEIIRIGIFSEIHGIRIFSEINTISTDWHFAGPNHLELDKGLRTVYIRYALVPW